MSAPLLSVRDLVVAAGERRVVDGIGFDLAAGEVLALVGESGSGKSATARAILGLLPPGLRLAGGSILFQGTEIAGAEARRLRPLRGPGIGMVFQEPMTSLNPAMTIFAQMGEAYRQHRRATAGETRAACEKMLARVGIDTSRMHAYPHEFSGGQRQRIMLASVMLLRPKLLIADEPTTALDTLTQAEVLDLMADLTREQGTSVLLITHNLALVARYAARAAVMQQGRIVEEGAAAPLLAAPRHPYTQRLVDALPRRAPMPARPPTPPLIEAQAISVAYPGRGGLFRKALPTLAVREVSLSIREGEVVALVGGSGSGKTTLGRAMLRLVPASGGALRFRGLDVTSLAGPALLPFRLACQIVFQDPYASLDPRMRIGAIVAEPLRLPAGIAQAERAARAEAMLDQVGLGGLAARFPHQLSGGQRQRVAIARALVREPAFVVADEPVSALDMTVQKQVLDLLRDLQQRRGFACLFVTHDLAVAEEISDRVVVMEKGSVVEEGSRDLLFDAPRHPYTRALLAAAPRLAG